MTRQIIRRLAVALGVLATLLAPAPAVGFHASIQGLSRNDCATVNRLPYLSATSVFDCSTLSYDGTDVTLASGQLVGPTGTAAAPTVTSTGTLTRGLFFGTADRVSISTESTEQVRFGGATVLLPSTATIEWLSGSLAAGGSSDLVLARVAAANVRHGAAAANPPVAQTLSVQNASGTDIAGANFTLDASQGTGAGAGGSIVFRTAPAGVAGAALNALVSKWSIDSAGSLLPTTTNADNIGSASLRPLQIFAGTSGIDSTGNIFVATAKGLFSSGGDGFTFVTNRTTPGGTVKIGSNDFSLTTGAASPFGVAPSFVPASGSASFAAVHLNPTINGTSTGTAYGLLLASKTNTLTGGTITLASLGTTTTDGFTGYTEVFAVSTAGMVQVAAAGGLRWNGRGTLSAPADGINIHSNSAGTGYTRFILGQNTTTGVSLVKSGTALQVALGDGTLGGSIMGIPVATQTIADTDTITADACGTVKRISSAGAVTTNTTNTFTAPAAANAGCVMYVVNVGANNITLDNNANFKSPGGLDVVLTADDAIIVGSTGASGVWYALSALVAN